MTELQVSSREVKHRQGIYNEDAQMRAKHKKAQHAALQFWASIMAGATVGAFILYQFAINFGWV